MTTLGTHAPAGRARMGGALSGALVALAVTAAVAASLRDGGTSSPVSPRRLDPPVVGDELPVTAMDSTVQPAHNSPLVVAHPNDERFVVIANRVDAPGFGCSLQVSSDGGRSWTTRDPVAALPQGAERCYAPDAAFDRRGDLLYSFVGLHGPGNEPMGVFLTTSADGAVTWSEPRQVQGPFNFGVRMAIDRSTGPSGRMHLVWIHATSDPPTGGFGPPPNPILTAHSDDGGITFSTPIDLSGSLHPLAAAPTIAIGPGQAVHVGFYDLGDDRRDYLGLDGPVWDGTWSVVVASSRDGGARFERPITANGDVRPWARPMLIYTLAPPAVVSFDNGRLCAGWTDARHGDADALVSCSSDRASWASWTSPIRLNDDAVGNGRAQYLPQLAVAPDGRLDAVFLDRRREAAGLRADVSYTYSEDGGGHFAPNVRITSEPSDIRVGQQYTNTSAQGQYEIGSRLGLLAHRDNVLVVWPDARNSVPSSTAQDLFSTVVGFGDRGDGTQSSGASDGAGTGTVDVAMADGRFDFSTDVPAGRVAFRVRNTGTDEHRLDLVPLDDHVPPIEEQVRGTTRQQVRPLANIATQVPGESSAFAVDLVAGRRYAVVCYVRDPDGRSHAAKGMAAEFRAGKAGRGT